MAGEAAGELVAAAFVAKTYRMVSDPATDAVIAWGRENNSFVVLDPFTFSQILLPSYFKHSNFSSFVRQLNTYGFRKVDPDRWEFAHASFLRGRKNLLRHIVRRKKGKGEEEDSEAVAVELVRLKGEQRAIGERADRVWQRLQEAERRPHQMLSFLVKLAGDPQMIGRLIENAGAGEGEDIGWKKRARVCLEGSGPLPALMPVEEAAGAAGFFGLEGFGVGVDGEEDPFFVNYSF